MFVSQTTVAVLVVLLALVAYDKGRKALAKGSSRKRDLESPASPLVSSFKDVKNNHVETSHDEVFISSDHEKKQQEEMDHYKQLYHKLHHLEDYPEILPECKRLLVALLSETISAALNERESTILAIGEFSQEGLAKFMRVKDVEATNSWEEYLTRRKSGSPREMFSDKEEAKWWLKQAAPVKYVDGAWLGHINKTSTPFELRKITKNAWQVMSEELGDGDLAKNHVYVYEALMRDIDAKLPPADSADFISPRHELNQLRCWKAAIAQLLISLFPHDFLPEILGFNMAYESLPVHLLKTVKELRELRLDPYYFQLHISIDNADSGHAAMAMAAVIDYIDLVVARDGEKAGIVAWKRVQAGYVLADGLPTTPESPSLKMTNKPQPVVWNDKEVAVLKVFAAKAPVAHKIHCNSRLRIGRHTLVDWLDPTAFQDPRWRQDFLHDLGRCKPWVIGGNSEKSKLVQELSWGGRMFGSFTQTEVEAVKSWIDSFGQEQEKSCPDPDVYYRFIELSLATETPEPKNNILADYPCLVPVSRPPNRLSQPESDSVNSPPLSIRNRELNIKQLIPLWFASTALLEALPSVPIRASNEFGSALVRVLRAQTGFSNEGSGVAGMDEVRLTDAGQAIGIIDLGIEICSRSGLGRPKTLEEAVQLGDEEKRQVAEYMIATGMRWLANRDLLVGMSWAFMELHELLAQIEGGGSDRLILGDQSREVLQHIAEREREGLEVCKKEFEQDPARTEKFWRGVAISREAIQRCFSCC